MLGHRELAMEDYIGILKRRLWLLLVCMVVCLAIGVGISHLLPPQYMSVTTVLIEQQKVPEDYVKPVVEEDLGARLATMKEQILSRSRIEPIIERFNLYPGNKYNMDERVDMTQKAIGIQPMPSGQSHGMPGFSITFKAQDPRTAQMVCGEITSLFVSENLNAREESAEGTTDFLKQQLDDSKRNLDDQDAKLAAFEQKYLGKLPNQEGENSNTLQALTVQLDSSTQSLNRLQQNETFIEAMIAEQKRELGNSDSSGGVTPDDRRKQLKELMAQKQEMDALYTPDYPDVVAISRKIADLKAEIAHSPVDAAPATANTKQADSPQLQQLKAQLRGVQQSIAATKLDQVHLQQQVRAYEARIDSSPQIEEEYKQITRDHDSALQFYNALLNKMNESSMATALEHRQEGEQFRVLDPPSLPDAPSFPNRRNYAAGGFAIGTMLGVLLAALLEYSDNTLHDERDIWAMTKLPTLAVVSYLEDLSLPARTRRLWNPFSRKNKLVESARG